MFGRDPNAGGANAGRVPTKAELEARLPPLRRFVVTLRQTEQVEVLAHEINLGMAALFTRYRVIGDGQVREQLVYGTGNVEYSVVEDEELPFDPARSTLRIQ